MTRQFARMAVTLAIVTMGFGACTRQVAGEEGQAKVKEDRTSYLDNAEMRLGVKLDLGGAITYISKAGSEENLINSADWGRQVQMSFYSGPNPFAPNGKQPTPTWAGLGWNPIQVGDCFGNRAKLVEHRNDGKSLYVKSIPMQWPLNNEPGECTFECWISLEGHAVHVRSKIVNHRVDKTQYTGRDQELPAIYTNGPWYRLLTYTGDKPFTGGALSTMPAKMPWSGWQATESWAALVNEADFGLGVFEPGVHRFIGGFAGKPGKGGPKDGPTGYIAPLHVDILDHNIEYEYSYDLILGSVEQIRKYVYNHAARAAAPSWRFEKDRQHWVYANAQDTGWPILGQLELKVEQEDPQMLSPLGLWQAADAPKLYIEAAYHTSNGSAEVFWSRADAPGFAGARSVRFDVVPDGKYRVYEVDLSVSPEYTGAITGLRFDPVLTGKPGDVVRVKSISLRK